jgi:hypothetical protein
MASVAFTRAKYTDFITALVARLTETISYMIYVFRKYKRAPYVIPIDKYLLTKGRYQGERMSKVSSHSH